MYCRNFSVRFEPKLHSWCRSKDNTILKTTRWAEVENMYLLSFKYIQAKFRGHETDFYKLWQTDNIQRFMLFKNNETRNSVTNFEKIWVQTRASIKVFYTKAFTRKTCNKEKLLGECSLNNRVVSLASFHRSSGIFSNQMTIPAWWAQFRSSEQYFLLPLKGRQAKLALGR